MLLNETSVDERFGNARAIANMASEGPRWNLHFNLESRQRERPLLKEVSATVLKQKGIISLAAARPLAETYPWHSFTAAIKNPTNVVSSCLSSASTLDSQSPASGIALSNAWGYGSPAGEPDLVAFIATHVSAVHKPSYSGWTCALTSGTTSALHIILRMLCDRGSTILTEEYTYTGIFAAASPLGISSVGIAMDDQGILPEALERVLREWKEERDGSRPRVLYTIPTGQNPTGTTQSLTRREAVLQVAENFDLIIIEDDPYYYLHSGNPTCTSEKSNVDSYLSLLPRSLLSLDTSGRVIRLDSASKILAPGLRLGWLTASSTFVKAFENYVEVDTVMPSGASQWFLGQCFEQWGQRGFLRWLMSLSQHYAAKRSTMLKILEREMASEKTRWMCPQGGMFIWVGVRDGDRLEEELYNEALERGVAYNQGEWFRAAPESEKKKEGEDWIWLRLSIAAATLEQIEEGVKRLGKAVKERSIYA